jgi:hypothetical protein
LRFSRLESGQEVSKRPYLTIRPFEKRKLVLAQSERKRSYPLAYPIPVSGSGEAEPGPPDQRGRTPDPRPGPATRTRDPDQQPGPETRTSNPDQATRTRNLGPRSPDPDLGFRSRSRSCPRSSSKEQSVVAFCSHGLLFRGQKANYSAPFAAGAAAPAMGHTRRARRARQAGRVMRTVPFYFLAKPQPRDRVWDHQRGKKTLFSLTLV